MSEYKIPVWYNGELIGWTDEKTSTIEYVNEESRNLIEDKLSQPLSVSSRSVGEINKDGIVEITSRVEDVILKQKEYIMLQQGNIFDEWELSYGRTTDKKKLLDKRDELIRLNVPKFFRGYKVFEITEVE